MRGNSDGCFLLHSKFRPYSGLLARSSYHSIWARPVSSTPGLLCSLPSKSAGEKTGENIYIVQLPHLFSDQKLVYTSILLDKEGDMPKLRYFFPSRESKVGRNPYVNQRPQSWRKNNLEKI